ncbi:hypothetical protein [Pedobacter endophyticus]|uniref:Uncharacterized protein n=1 Tax=Pedobacter endophyticus TaxID=2789740 RepID=A0A7U3Q5A3_9SPHI|nr:hypothetical protein [Pedobacter endophyticus]QPH38717.1 hypothetical protein IZT61_16820 [Pedobacter endophyticus]
MMEITILKPIVVNQFKFNKQYLSKLKVSSSYQSFFYYHFNSSNSFTIVFKIIYTVGDKWKDTIIPSREPNKWSVHLSGEAGSGKILFIYNYSCRVKFLSEGYESDVTSLTSFVDQFYSHIQHILQDPELELVQKKEREILASRPSTDIAIEIIDNLRSMKMYD